MEIQAGETYCVLRITSTLLVSIEIMEWKERKEGRKLSYFLSILFFLSQQNQDDIIHTKRLNIYNMTRQVKSRKNSVQFGVERVENLQRSFLTNGEGD